jgi:hypothetical protein
MSNGEVMQVRRDDKPPWEGGARFSFRLEGFETEEVASSAGAKLVDALLWTAIKLKFPVMIDCASTTRHSVYDRRGGAGFSAKGYGTAGWDSERFLDELRSAYDSLRTAEPALLLSMEILAGARMETSERAKFIACVSALEPLAQAQELSAETQAFVDSCLAALPQPVGEETPEHASLKGRLKQLKHESIRQAIKRVIRAEFPGDRSVLTDVDRAYGIRSELVHEGRALDPEVDLPSLTERILGVLRRIYARRLKQDLLPEEAG